MDIGIRSLDLLYRPHCMNKFDCEKSIEDNKQPYLSMNHKRVHMYSKMVEDMLQMRKIHDGATLECKWEALKKVISHAQT